MTASSCRDIGRHAQSRWETPSLKLYKIQLHNNNKNNDENNNNNNINYIQSSSLRVNKTKLGFFTRIHLDNFL